jgi:hypothetical protein
VVPAGSVGAFADTTCPAPVVPNPLIGDGSACRDAGAGRPGPGQRSTGGRSGALYGRRGLRGTRLGDWGGPTMGAFPCVGALHPCPPPAVGSFTGLGVRLLSWPELTALWDVPILISDRLTQPLDVELLRGFCSSAPAKVLFVGADALLTTSFRGGSISFGGSIPFSPGLVAATAPGPTPKTDAELGLAGSSLAAACKTQPHVQNVKGDTQKADSVAVLDHLWVHAFLCGYGRDHPGPRYLQALGLSAEASVGGLGNPSPPEGWEATTSGLSTLALFRSFALRWWRRQVLRGFLAWPGCNVRVTKGCSPGQMVRPLLSTKEGEGVPLFAWATKGRASYKAQWTFIHASPDGQATVRAGHDAIRRSAQASWFEWLEGSAPFFWNWSEAYQREVQDGQRHFLTAPLPVFLKPQKRHRDAASHELMHKKVVQVRKRGYISSRPVVSGTHYFSVPKGLDGIRMVYNGTSCGLNDVL